MANEDTSSSLFFSTCCSTEETVDAGGSYGRWGRRITGGRACTAGAKEQGWRCSRDSVTNRSGASDNISWLQHLRSGLDGQEIHSNWTRHRHGERVQLLINMSVQKGQWAWCTGGSEQLGCELCWRVSLQKAEWIIHKALWDRNS